MGDFGRCESVVLCPNLLRMLPYPKTNRFWDHRRDIDSQVHAQVAANSKCTCRFWAARARGLRGQSTRRSVYPDFFYYNKKGKPEIPPCAWIQWHSRWKRVKTRLHSCVSLPVETVGHVFNLTNFIGIGQWCRLQGDKYETWPSRLLKTATGRRMPWAQSLLSLKTTMKTTMRQL